MERFHEKYCCIVQPNVLRIVGFYVRHSAVVTGLVFILSYWNSDIVYLHFCAKIPVFGYRSTCYYFQNSYPLAKLCGLWDASELSFWTKLSVSRSMLLLQNGFKASLTVPVTLFSFLLRIPNKNPWKSCVIEFFFVSL